MWYNDCMLMSPKQLGSIPRLNWSGDPSKIKRKGYARFPSTYIHSTDGMKRERFGLVVEIGKDETAFEIVRSPDPESMTWFPIHATVFDSLFPTLVGLRKSPSWEGSVDLTKTLRIQNRILFVYKNADVRERLCWSISVRRIHATLPFFFLMDYGQEISTAELFYPKVTSMEVAKKVIVALQDIGCASSRTVSDVWGSTFDDGKAEALEDIANFRREIESSENELQRICDKAADAMNVLGSKYGIEIEV